MSRTPTRPGNEHTWHGERADYWDRLERAVLHLVIPATGLITLGLVAGITIAEVSRWIG